MKFRNDVGLARFATAAATTLLLVAVAGSFSCAPYHERIDPDMDDQVGGGGTESSDVRAMADQFTRDLLAQEHLFAGGKRPTLIIQGLINEGSHHIDKRMVLEMMRSRIVNMGGGKIRVLDRDGQTFEAIRDERAAKRAGEVQGGEKKALLGSDYVLSGTVRTISKRGQDGMSSDYWVYLFKLTDLESSELVWASQPYEFKWRGNKPAIYR